MTHKELVARAEKWLMNTMGCGFCFTELTCNSYTGEIPDAIGWRGGYSFLVECKTTRADFQTDAKKIFRYEPKEGMGNYRYFMTPPNLISPDELPKRWGLLYARRTQTRIIKACMSDNIFQTDAVALREAPLLHSALRRVYLRGDLPKIYDSVWKQPPGGGEGGSL
jgi:hypothetical protein